MSPMRAETEEQLAELLELLPPAPEAWVRAAQELPLVRRRFDELVGRALADRTFREQVTADLEAALLAAGIEPGRVLVDELRGRLANG